MSQKQVHELHRSELRPSPSKSLKGQTVLSQRFTLNFQTYRKFLEMHL